MNEPTFTVVLNPASGNRRGQRFLPEIERVAGERGGQVVCTDRPSHAALLAREAVARGVRLVFAAGGDDTVREVVTAVFDSPARLGIIPLGTFNNFASSLLLPRHPLDALVASLQGQDERVDLGQVVGGPIFTESVGVGIDAEAWSLAPEEEPVGLGRWLTGIRLGLTSLSTFSPEHIRITVDGEPTESQVMQVTVANSRFFGAGIQMAPQARLDDGLLDVCVIPLMSKLQFLAAVPLIYSGRHLDLMPEVHHHRGREVLVTARRPLAVRVDGVIATRLPLQVRALPGALGVRVPRPPKSGGAPARPAR